MFKLYELISAFLFLIFNTFTYMSPKGKFTTFNLLISWAFFIIYISFLIKMSGGIGYMGTMIYCIGYLFFALELTITYLTNRDLAKWSVITNKLRMIGAILFAIGSIIFMYSVKTTTNIKDIFNKNTLMEFVINKKLLVLFGSLMFLLGSTAFMMGYKKSNSIYFKNGLLLFIVGRVYFLYHEYVSL